MLARSPWRRGLCLALVVLFTLTSVVPSSLRADPREKVRAVASEVEAKAGGWGLLTPVIAFAARGVRAAAAPDETRGDELRDVPSYLGDGTFLGGLAGGMALAQLFGHLAPMIPGGIFVRTAVAMCGGFIGCELGSGNIGQTDWLNLWTQVAVASVVQIGGAALGLGGLPLLLVTAGTAIAAGILLDKIRGKGALAESRGRGEEEGEEESAVRVGEAGAEGKGEEERKREEGDEEAARGARSAYTRLVGVLRDGGRDVDLQDALAGYGQAQRSLAAARQVAYATP